jgi:alpha-mannosidase
LKKAQFVFVAADIPSIGYRTFYLRADQHPVKVRGETAGEARSAENRFYRIGLSGGGVSGIFDKEFKREVLDTRKFLGGELFTLQSVGTDAGEFAEIQQPTMEGFDKLSNYSPVWRRTESGPVRSVYSMEQSIPGVTIVQRIILYHGIKQIDLQTSLLKWNGTPYREFRLAFPVNAPSGRVAYEVPFGTVEVGKDELRDPAGERYVQRPSEVHPRSIQRWISVSDDKMGVTFASSVAVWDHIDPTGSPLASPLLQPILLASRRSCHPEGNWYLQEGDHEFTFSMTSHEPGWNHAYRFGVGAATSLGVVYDPHTRPEADLPEEKEFFSVSARNIMVTTLKKCDDDNNVIVRLFEAEGKDTDVAVRCMVPIQNAEQTNIIEEDGRRIRTHGSELRIRVGHHAIETFKWKASQ